MRIPVDICCAILISRTQLHAVTGFEKVGDVAQLGERGVRNAEARGSIPLISTMDNKRGCFF